jgi:hypothetical protein
MNSRATASKAASKADLMRGSAVAGLRPVFLSLANKVGGIEPIFFHVTKMTRSCAQRIDFDQTQMVAFNCGPARPLRDFT